MIFRVLAEMFVILLSLTAVVCVFQFFSSFEVAGGEVIFKVFGLPARRLRISDIDSIELTEGSPVISDLRPSLFFSQHLGGSLSRQFIVVRMSTGILRKIVIRPASAKKLFDEIEGARARL
jgi:hypothetical protein